MKKKVSDLANIMMEQELLQKGRTVQNSPQEKEPEQPRLRRATLQLAQEIDSGINPRTGRKNMATPKLPALKPKKPYIELTEKKKDALKVSQELTY